MLGSRGTIETDHVDAHILQNGESRVDISAEQHAPGRVERDLRLVHLPLDGLGGLLGGLLGNLVDRLTRPPGFGQGHVIDFIQLPHFAVFNVAEGAGRVTIEGHSFDFEPHDIFVAPSWCEVSFVAREESVIFSYSDRAAQEALGFFREA